MIDPLQYFWASLVAQAVRKIVNWKVPQSGLYSPWNSLGQNTGLNSFSFLHGIFPTQRWNPDLPIADGFFTG